MAFVVYGSLFKISHYAFYLRCMLLTSCILCREIIKLTEFLGSGNKERLMRNNEKLLNDVIEHSSFSNMQASVKNFVSAKVIIGYTSGGQTVHTKGHIGKNFEAYRGPH